VLLLHELLAVWYIMYDTVLASDALLTDAPLISYATPGGTTASGGAT